MCLSIPGKVIEVTDSLAKVKIGEATYDAGIQLVEDIKVGDYALVHAGFIIQILDPKEAEATLKLFQEAVDKGVFDSDP